MLAYFAGWLADEVPIVQKMLQQRNMIFGLLTMGLLQRTE
jgi:hypothetical protein